MPGPVFVSAEGSFTSTDPVFMSSGPAWASPYTYANNSPARYTDPAGRDALDDAGQAIMGAGDTMTFGFTGWVRENNPWFDTAGAADYCSGWYTAGAYVGAAASIVMVPGGLGLGVSTATMRMAARTGLARVEAFLARTGTSLLTKGGTLAKALPAAARTATRELTTLARQAGTTARAGIQRARTVAATGERGSLRIGGGADEAAITAAGRASAARKALGVGTRRNVAIADYSISGTSGELVGVSGTAVRPGTVGVPSNPVFLPSSTGGFSRALDAE